MKKILTLILALAAVTAFASGEFEKLFSTPNGSVGWTSKGGPIGYLFRYENPWTTTSDAGGVNLTGTATFVRARYMVLFDKLVVYQFSTTGKSVTAANTLTELHFTYPVPQTSVTDDSLGSCFTQTSGTIQIISAAISDLTGSNATTGAAGWMSGSATGPVTIICGGWYML